MKKKTASPADTSAEVSAFLTFDGETQKKTASTIKDAVAQFDLPIKAKSIIRIETQGKAAEVSILPFQLRKLRFNALSRELFEKRITDALR